MTTMPDADATADPYLRVHAVNIYVKDQERSLRFYQETLGFRVAFDARVGSGHRLLAVAPPDGTAVLMLIQPEPDSPQCRHIGRATQVVFVTEDLPATYREWRRRGVRFRSTPRLRRVVYEQAGASPSLAPPGLAARHRLPPVWGGVFVPFEDVDGNSFALVSLDELSRAVEAERRAADGQPAGQSAQPVRDCRGTARTAAAVREPALLREHGRQRLRHVLLFRIRRQSRTAALWKLRTPTGPAASSRRRHRSSCGHCAGSGPLHRVGMPHERTPALPRRSPRHLHRRGHRGLQRERRGIWRGTADRGAARASQPGSGR